MKILNKPVIALTLAFVLALGAFYLNSLALIDAHGWATENLYMDGSKNYRDTADWTYLAFH